MNHRPIEMENRVTAGAYSRAKFRIFSCHQSLVVATNCLENLATHKCFSAAKLDCTGGHDPIQVQHPVVNRSLGIALAAIAEHYAYPRIAEFGESLLNEAWRQNGVAIEEKHDSSAGGVPACISTCRRARVRGRNGNDSCAKLRGALDAAVVRCRVHIDDLPRANLRTCRDDRL